jgi:hypothetical protein
MPPSRDNYWMVGKPEIEPKGLPFGHIVNLRPEVVRYR